MTPLEPLNIRDSVNTSYMRRIDCGALGANYIGESGSTTSISRGIGKRSVVYVQLSARTILSRGGSRRLSLCKSKSKYKNKNKSVPAVIGDALELNLKAI